MKILKDRFSLGVFGFKSKIEIAKIKKLIRINVKFPTLLKVRRPTTTAFGR